MSTKVINEVSFQEFDKENVKTGSIDNQEAIINASVDLDATIGSTTKTIRDMWELKVDDIILFNKKSEELYDIRVNEIKFAEGETLYMDGKLCIRLLQL